MKHLSRKTFVALIVSFALVIAAAGFFGMLWYTLGVYEARFWSASEELAYREAAKQQALSLKQLLEETVSDRAELEALVLAEADIAAFLSETERIGRMLGLSVRTVSVSKEPVKGEALFEPVMLQLEMTGPLVQVERMIGLFASFPYRIVVDRAVLDRAVTEMGSVEWRATLDLTVAAFKGS